MHGAVFLARCWLAPAGASAVESAALQVETGSPDALCPDLTLTREAVQRRLGTLVAPAGDGWRARYTIGHAPEGTPRDFVRLELFGPDGARELVRDLPLEESCAMMADVIALVLDRHFRGLPEQDREPPVTEPVPVTAPADSVTPEPAPSVDATAPRRLVLGVELCARYPFAPHAGLRLTGEAADNLYFGGGVGAALLPEEERLQAGGSVELSSLLLHVHAGWGPRFDRVRTYVGPGVRVTLDRGSAQGLVEADTRYRAVWAGGLHAGVLGPLSERFFLMLTGAVDWSIDALSGRFVVEGRDVLRPHGTQAWFGIGIGYAP